MVAFFFYFFFFFFILVSLRVAASFLEMQEFNSVSVYFLMANRPDPDIDDDFRELYKEYTGPPGSAATNTQERAKPNKRSNAGSDEEDEGRDPNAVPTDFTSREAKVWEAKSKATERNWKKRKEEEMICKLCGESGHFTQV